MGLYQQAVALQGLTATTCKQLRASLPLSQGPRTNLLRGRDLCLLGRRLAQLPGVHSLGRALWRQGHRNKGVQLVVDHPGCRAGRAYEESFSTQLELTVVEEHELTHNKH